MKDGSTPKTIVVADSGLVRTITLRRPERRNAIDPDMQMELTAAFDEAAASQCRVVVLTGAGEAFCSGLDLAATAEFPGKTQADYHAEAQRIAQMYLALYELPVPTIALVRGPALAGGAGLALLCDFTLATPNATFGFTEVRVGVVPAMVSVFLTLLLGEKCSRDLLLSGRILRAEEAQRLGLVSEIVPHEELLERLEALTETLCANSPAALSATKRLLAAQNQAWLVAAIGHAIQARVESRQTPDFREGVAAFLAKRKPSWTT
jgi:methylglutaconyl-CoA hydratase